MLKSKDIALFMLACIPAVSLTIFAAQSIHEMRMEAKRHVDAQTEFEIYKENVPSLLEEAVETNRYVTDASVTIVTKYVLEYDLDMITDYKVTCTLTEAFDTLDEKTQYLTLGNAVNHAAWMVEADLEGTMPNYCEIVGWHSGERISGHNDIMGSTDAHTYKLYQDLSGKFLLVDGVEHEISNNVFTPTPSSQHHTTSNHSSSGTTSYYYYRDPDDYDVGGYYEDNRDIYDNFDDAYDDFEDDMEDLMDDY